MVHQKEKDIRLDVLFLFDIPLPRENKNCRNDLGTRDRCWRFSKLDIAGVQSSFEHPDGATIICQTECNFDVDPSSKCRPSATDNVFEELKGWLIRFFVIGRDLSRSIDNSTVF